MKLASRRKRRRQSSSRGFASEEHVVVRVSPSHYAIAGRSDGFGLSWNVVVRLVQSHTYGLYLCCTSYVAQENIHRFGSPI